MNKLQKRILKLEYKPNCYILHSFGQRSYEDTCGDFRVKALMSFLYDVGEYAAEWEPEYGPIQEWHKCEEGAEDSREHYYFDFTDSGPGNWSQMAVDTHELPQAANRGDYDYIFSVLKDWIKR